MERSEIREILTPHSALLHAGYSALAGQPSPRVKCLTANRGTCMQTQTQSPLKTYLDHLERGELAYQFSPTANRAVFYPRVLCPFTGSDKLEWRVSTGAGTVYATTIVHPPEGAPFNVALIDCD